MSNTPGRMMSEVENQKKCFEARCEQIALNAKLMRQCFESCRKEGFNVGQAMSMMMERGPDLIYPDDSDGSCDCDDCNPKG